VVHNFHVGNGDFPVSRPFFQFRSPKIHRLRAKFATIGEESPPVAAKRFRVRRLFRDKPHPCPSFGTAEFPSLVGLSTGTKEFLIRVAAMLMHARLRDCLLICKA